MVRFKISPEKAQHHILWCDHFSFWEFTPDIGTEYVMVI